MAKPPNLQSINERIQFHARGLADAKGPTGIAYHKNALNHAVTEHDKVFGGAERRARMDAGAMRSFERRHETQAPQTGPRGGRYVETAAGKRYIGHETATSHHNLSGPMAVKKQESVPSYVPRGFQDSPKARAAWKKLLG